MSRIYRATIRCHKGGILIEPSLHYKVDVPAGGSEPPPNDVAGDIWGHIGAAFKENTPTDVSIDELVVTERVIPPDIGAAGSFVIALAGTLPAAANDLPVGLVPVINIHSAVSSRSARGWVHLPSPQRSDYCQLNTWSSTYQTLLGAFCSDANDSFDMGGVFPPTLVPVVYSRTRHLRGEDPFSFDVTTMTVNPTPKWLRSRMTAP
jgi:hypothetical protein